MTSSGEPSCGRWYLLRPRFGQTWEDAVDGDGDGDGDGPASCYADGTVVFSVGCHLMLPLPLPMSCNEPSCVFTEFFVVRSVFPRLLLLLAAPSRLNYFRATIFPTTPTGPGYRTDAADRAKKSID